MLHAEQKQSAYEVVYDRIISGDIQPGQRISEKALAREMGCSIIPIREALSHLISMGVFRKVPHYGTFATQLTPEDMLMQADYRLMTYTYAVGLAAARPDPKGILELKDAFNAFETHIQQTADPALATASEPVWLEFLTQTIKGLLRVYRGIVLAAGLTSQREVYERGDLMYILASRSIWSALSRESMIGFIKECFIADPMSCFLSAIDVRDSAEAQRLHFEQHQRTTLNVMQRLAASSVEFPAPVHLPPQLKQVQFVFSISNLETQIRSV